MSLIDGRWRTVLLVAVTALISAVAVFAAAYQQSVQQSLVDSTFTIQGPGNTWSMIGDSDRLINSIVPVSLSDLIPAESRSLIERPVTGRSAVARWNSTRIAELGLYVRGTQLWREDICAHLTMVAGHCPAAPAEVAVSAADARGYGLRPRDAIGVGGESGGSNPFTVSGVYRVKDPDDPYWFGNPPVGESLVDLTEEGRSRSDPLVTTQWSWYRSYQETLDVRLDVRTLRLDDLRTVSALTPYLDHSLAGRGRVVTDVPASLDRISQERARAVAGLTLSLVQVAVLVAVVLALLAAVELSSQRSELGLARLHGEPAHGLQRLVLTRWVSVVSIGWLLGWVPGVAVAVLLARQLPGERGLLVGPALVVVPVLVLLGMAAAMVFPARTLLREPVAALLRSAPAARDPRGRVALIDAALLVLATSGLLVAYQVGTSSTLGLLVPSLLAIGLAVILLRIMLRLTTARHRSLSLTGRRAGAVLFTAWLIRLRGLRLLVVGTTVAATFAVLAVQLQTIGADVRRHDAQVRTGAATVVQVAGQPGAVTRALDRLDPRHRTADAAMTPVIVTRREDNRAVRGMFVEPAAFSRIAYGADRTAQPGEWTRIAAPTIAPIAVTGDSIIAEVGSHLQLGRRTSSGDLGTHAELGLEYVSAEGLLRVATLGVLTLSASGDVRLEGSIGCANGCRLLRITLAPNGPMEGDIPIELSVADRSSGTRPVDLGAADQWASRPTSLVQDRFQVASRPNGSSVLTARSGGARLAVQHASLPLKLPVLVAAGTTLPSSPTLPTADQSPIAVEPVATGADAIPGQLDNVAVGDLSAMLLGGQGQPFSTTSVQVWMAPEADGRLDELRQALAEEGAVVTAIRTAEQAVADSEATAPALSGQIAPGLAVVAAVFAGLGIALTMSGHRPVLGRDLTGLRRSGVGMSTGRRALTQVYLLPVLLAVGLGAVAGIVGCALVITGLPLVADPQAAIHLDLQLRVVPLIISLVAAGTAVSVLVLTGVHRLTRSVDRFHLGDIS